MGKDDDTTAGQGEGSGGESVLDTLTTLIASEASQVTTGDRMHAAEIRRLTLQADTAINLGIGIALMLGCDKRELRLTQELIASFNKCCRVEVESLDDGSYLVKVVDR